MSNERRRRSWLQFGFRSVMVATLAVALVLGFGRAYVDPYFAQQRALEALKNHQLSLGTTYTLPRRMKWLEKIDPEGAERYREVTHLDMTGGDFAQRHLRHLLAMRQVESLVIRGERFDATHLAKLIELPALELLVLDATSVTQEELAQLAAHRPQLKIRLSQRAVFEHGLEQNMIGLRNMAQARARWRFAGNTTVRQPNPSGLRYELSSYGSYCSPIPSSPDFKFWQSANDPADSLNIVHWLDAKTISLSAPDDAAVEGLREARTTRTLIARRSRMTAAGLKMLAAMPDLDRLDMISPVHPPHLAFVAPCRDLRRLTWVNAGATDEALVHLRGLHKLQTLVLTGNPIRGEGLAQLQDLPLQTLSLDKTQLNNRAAGVIARISTVRELDASDTTVDGEFVAQLVGLPNLVKLSLRNTHIDDDALQHVGAIASLESLSLQNTSITDEGIRHLQSLDRLRHLDLGLTDLSEEAVAELLDAIPLSSVTR